MFEENYKIAENLVLVSLAILWNFRLLINVIQQKGDTPSYLDYVEKTEHRFQLKTTDCSTVFSLLSKFCKSKATGLDKMSA